MGRQLNITKIESFCRAETFHPALFFVKIGFVSQRLKKPKLINYSNTDSQVPYGFL